MRKSPWNGSGNDTDATARPPWERSVENDPILCWRLGR